MLIEEVFFALYAIWHVVERKRNWDSDLSRYRKFLAGASALVCVRFLAASQVRH